MKPYESYKKADQLWLQDVPSHWKMIKTKYLFDERTEKGYPDEPLLVASQNMGVVPKGVYGNRTVEATKDLHLLKLVKIGDFVISLRSFQGGIEYAYYQGIISPAYTIMVPKNDISTGFFRHLAKSKAFIELLQLCVTGIREGQNIDYVKLKNFRLPVPPRIEQDQIVRFLDWKLSQLNKLIKAKKKQIVLLNEQKQALINKAVTKGLDDSVAMKDSGVYWLGDIPTNWKSNRLKRFCKVNASISHLISDYNDEEMVVFLPMENVSVQGEIDCSILRKFKDVRSGYSSFARNDVVVAKITPCFENGKGACLDNLETEIGYGTTEFITLRAYESILPKYLYYITRTSYFRLFGAEVMTGSAGQKRVPTDFISNFIIGIPQKIEEQRMIVDYIEKTTLMINNTLSKLTKELDYITEYKAALISSVVTGKIDVRDVVVPDCEIDDEVLEEETEAFSDEIEASEVDE